MASELFIPPSKALDANANPYSGAKWFFYATGTTTPQTVYTTDARNVAHANPVVADSTGKFANIFFDPALIYRGVLKNADESVTLYDIDPISSSLIAVFSDAAGSDLVGFSHANTYAPGTIGDNLKRFVCVTDAPFNAKGDGVTDDTAAIQAAVDYMTEAGTLYFPVGRYRLTDEIVVGSVGGTVFAGAGGNDAVFGAPVPSGNGTFIFQETDNKSIFKLGGGSSYLAWQDMTLSSTNTPGASPVGTGRYGIDIESTLPFVLWRLSFTRVIFFNLSRGVSCVDTAAGTHGSGQDLSIAPVSFNDCFWTYCQTGVYMDTNNADLWKWSNCFFFIPSGGDGVILKSYGMLFFDVVTAGGTGVSNNRFLNIDLGALGSPEKISIKGLQTENLTHSVYIATGGAYTSPLTIHISDSIFELGSDFYLGDACHIVTDNNRFSNNQIYIDHADVKLTTINDQFASSDYSFLTGSADNSFVNTTWGPFPSALYGNRVYENGTKVIGSTAGVLNLTATTIITFPAEAALYEVFAYLTGGGPTLMNAVRIACDGTALLVAGGDAGPAGMTITVSGFNVQVNQSSGSTQTVQWRWRRIA